MAGIEHEIGVSIVLLVETTVSKSEEKGALFSYLPKKTHTFKTGFQPIRFLHCIGVH